MRPLFVPVTWTEADGRRPWVLRAVVPAGDTDGRTMLAVMAALLFSLGSSVVSSITDGDVEGALLLMTTMLVNAVWYADRGLHAWDVRNGAGEPAASLLTRWRTPESRGASLLGYAFLLFGLGWTVTHAARADLPRAWVVGLLLLLGLVVGALPYSLAEARAQGEVDPRSVLGVVAVGVVWALAPEAAQGGMMCAFVGSVLGLQVAVVRTARTRA